MKQQQQETIIKSMLSFALFIAICVSGANAEKVANIGMPEQTYIGPPTYVKVELLSAPPEISEEQMLQREEYISKMKHVPAGGKFDIKMPDKIITSMVTKQAISKNGGETSITVHDENTLAAPPSGAAGSFVFFENNDLGTSGAPLNQRSRINEPSVANNGRCVFYSGNWYASLSVNAGKTFQYINPYTAFGWPAGQDFCCDQIVIYDPSRDCLFWLLQSTKDGSSNNIHKLAVANSFSDIENQNWYVYDFDAESMGANFGTWLDFPDMVLGENYLYLTANYIGPDPTGSDSAASIRRLPLDELSTASGFGYSYYTRGWPDQRVFRPTHGASTTMYFAAHNNQATNSIRIYNWPEDGGLGADNVAITAWDNGYRSAAGPDGKQWLNHFPSSGGYVLGAWYTEGTIGFMWCAAQDGSHPYPYVRVARFNESTKALINEPNLWSPGYAWAFPSVNVNGRGDIAGSVMYGGGTHYPSCAVFIWDDYSVTPPGWEVHASVAGTSGPGIDRSGDYLTTRISYPHENTWMGTAFTLQGGGVNTNAVPRFLWYGRERDRPLYALLNDTPVIFSTIPKDFTFRTVSTEWCGIAINPSTNHNLKADDDDFRFDNIYQSSTYGGTTRDFIMSNGRDFGKATLYAQTYYGKDSPYTIEAEWEAYDLVVGKPVSDSIGSGEVIQVYEVNLTKGDLYKASVDITRGSVDIAMFGYEADRSSGDRGNRNWTANDYSAGGDESETFIAGSSGYHGIAVINENAQSGNYDILVELIPEPGAGIWIFGMLECWIIVKRRKRLTS